MRRQRAFTLVELLVVIGVIAVLIAILLPTLGRVRKQAQATACLSNLRQMGTAWVMYTADSKGRPHPSVSATRHAPPQGQQGWFINPPTSSTGGGLPSYFLQQYIGTAPQLYNCPSVEEPLGADFAFGSEATAWRPGAFAITPSMLETGTYAYNSWLSDSILFRVGYPEASQSFGGFVQKVSQIRSSSNFPVYSDGKWVESLLCLDTDILPSRAMQQAPLQGTALGGNYMTTVAIQRHNGGINVVFADGSARNVPIRELWSLQWSRVFKTRPTY